MTSVRGAPVAAMPCPSRNNAVSDDPADIAARDRLVYVYHYLFVEAALSGRLDMDLDQEAETEVPGLAGTIDWLGVQYYFRAGVSAANAIVPVLEEKAIAMGEDPPPSPFRDALRNDGGRWLLYEVAAMIVFGIASMFLDRYRRYQESKAPRTEP